MNLKNLQLHHKIGALVAGIVLAVAIVSQILFTNHEYAALSSRLIEKSTFLNTFYSFLIADSLARKDDITLSQVINRLESDPEITSVIVVDQRGQIRYHADSSKMGLVTDDPLIRSVLQSGDGVVNTFRNSGGQALALVSPLKIAGVSVPIGCVRIDMTYAQIEKQLQTVKRNYAFAIFGDIVFAFGIVMMMLQPWLLLPLDRVKKSIDNVHPRLLEANLPESDDHFGQIHASVNNLILKFKAELQASQGQASNLGQQEQELSHRLLRGFLPDARILIADKDNRVLSDSETGSGAQYLGKHLLDLITDTNFANLVATAFQSEGQVVRGTVQFETKAYQAAVLSVPSQQTQVVKTLIALVAEPS